MAAMFVIAFVVVAWVAILFVAGGRVVTNNGMRKKVRANSGRNLHNPKQDQGA